MTKHVIFLSIVFLCFGCNSFQPTRFEANMPNSPASQDETKIAEEKSIVITVKSDGKLFIENEELGNIKELSILERKISQLKKNESNNSESKSASQRIFVKAAKDVGYKDVVLLVDKLKSSGYENIELQVHNE